EEGVLGDGVAALGESDRSGRFHRLVNSAVVEAVSRMHVKPKSPEHLQMRLDGAPSDIAPSGVRQLELCVGMQQRAEKHDHRAGTPCRLEIHLVPEESSR